MASFKCPRCREETISFKDKYRLGWWLTTHCSNCGARLANFPWTLMLVHFMYVWNVIWWVALVHFKDSFHYLIYMVICWILLDLINVYFMPMACLKKKAA